MAGVARDGGGAYGKVVIERLCLSLPRVEKPFNLKVIKSFVPELRSRKCFCVSGFLCYLYMSYEHSIYVSRIHVWLCNTWCNRLPASLTEQSVASSILTRCFVWWKWLPSKAGRTGLASLFNGISIFVGYLMPKPRRGTTGILFMMVEMRRFIPISKGISQKANVF